MYLKRKVRKKNKNKELELSIGKFEVEITKLNNKNNQVVVEPDDRVWNALEKNKNSNNCEFNIVKRFISNKKLDLTNLDNLNMKNNIIEFKIIKNKINI